MTKEQRDTNLEKIKQKLAEQTDKSLTVVFTIINGELTDVEFLPTPVSSSESEIKEISPK
jgi:hypothetical protein